MKLVSTIVILLITSSLFGQLSGTYTIGGTNPDYATIYAAISALQTNGVSGPVTFNFRPGTYPGFSIDTIAHQTALDTVTFQSETHDSTSVIISGGSGTIMLNGCAHVTIRQLTIEATGYSPNYAIDFEQGFHCAVVNCLIHTPNSTGLTQSENTIKINHIWSGANAPVSSIAVVNCTFTGTGGGFDVVATSGTTTLLHNTLLSTGRYALTGNWTNGLMLKDNILNGEISAGGCTGTNFDRNLVTGPVVLGQFYSVDSNVFNSASAEVEATLITHNHFSGTFSLNRFGSIIKDNFFAGQADIGYCPGIHFIHNVTQGFVSIAFSDQTQFVANECYGYTAISQSNSVLAFNNIFYDWFDMGICNNSKVYNNNFGDTAQFRWSDQSADVRYNNFKTLPVMDPHAQPIYNNYYPILNGYDAHPYNFDPHYISSSNARSTNPALIGKGIGLSYPADIDGVLRPASPSIGANEICVSSFNSYTSLVITCGDTVALRYCTAPQGAYRWYPAYGLDDSLSASPDASPAVSTYYILRDSSGAGLDSVWVTVHPYRSYPIPTDSLSCAYMIRLEGAFDPSASYAWSPATGLSDTTIYDPWAHPLVTTTYIRTTSIPGCGVYYDTVTVPFDPRPTAYAEVYSYYLDGTFYNRSLCWDSALWVFGDGQTSMLRGDSFPVLHHYDIAGTYYGELIVCNSNSCDTFRFTIVVTDVGIRDIAADPVSVYPNPTSSTVTVYLGQSAVREAVYTISDMLGRQVYSATEFHPDKDYRKTIDLSALPGGVYIICISRDGVNTIRHLTKE